MDMITKKLTVSSLELQTEIMYGEGKMNALKVSLNGTLQWNSEFYRVEKFRT